MRACLLADGAPVSDDLLAQVSAGVWNQLPSAAAFHRVSPAAFVALRESKCVSSQVLETLHTGYEAGLRHHLLCCQVLGDVAARLDRAGYRFVAIKGPVLAETVYPRPDLREYADVDLLVRPAEFRDVLQILERLGGNVIERNWDLCLGLLKGELNIAVPEGVVVDLHWSLLYNDEMRKAFSYCDQELLTRSRSASLGESVVSVPDETDQLLHLCVHACLAGGHRLGWLQDIRRAATRRSIDWSVFWARARANRLELAAAVALDHVNRCFGSAFPVAVPTSAWRRLVASLDRHRPPENWTGGQLSGHLVPAATRTDTRTSITALERGIGVGVRELLCEPSHPWRRRGAGRGSVGLNHMLDDKGGQQGRREYLRAVEKVGDRLPDTT